MAVKQYPYRLKALIHSEGYFDESTAEWTEGTSEWVDFGVCRDEGSTSKKQTEDGEFYIQTSVIYAPKSIKNIDKGTKVQVWNGEELRLEGNVVNFTKDQLHTRIWL
jgi:hypothetical protein|nr:MAG TPA: hypothetical protein [Caudoviricetes sp.]DAL00410.1 MAG TPA: hypothetical protein [Caudoviricetes sp.]DAR74253.1 MAG TPA: hypothetical protein [Caudoviricetes sp.]DAW83706.1 MAG TPA: hypothetical protein [Caudoviricetes sp.]